MKNQEQKTILLVEDDAAAMMVEAHLLKSCGCDVVTANSGDFVLQSSIAMAFKRIRHE